MKPDKDKDITEHIVEVLRKHSLPYKEGAWERFREYEASRNKKTVLWPYLSGAAAIILLGIVLFLKQDEFATKPVRTIVHSDMPAEKNIPDPLNNKEVSSEDEEQSIVNDFGKSDQELGYVSRNSKLGNSAVTATVEGLSSIQVEQNVSVSQNRQRYALNNSPEKSVQDAEMGNQQATIQHKHEEQAHVQANRSYEQEKAYRNDEWAFGDDSETNPDLNQNLDKWDFSIELAPNINDRQQINFGGGLAVAYNINDKVSISSGVSYVQLDAQRGPNQIDIPAEFSKASLNSYNYNKSLNTINTTLVGLDIPVNLKVNLGTQVYASAGVSVFSVLSESRYNVFEEKIARVASVASDGKNNPAPAIQTVYSQEANPNTPYEGKNFTGFFNLSVGYKLPVFKNLNMSVEPYLKVPVGSLTDQDMNLGNGGLKIVTSF